jgi:hypothetical protein
VIVLFLLCDRFMMSCDVVSCESLVLFCLVLFRLVCHVVSCLTLVFSWDCIVIVLYCVVSSCPALWLFSLVAFLSSDSLVLPFLVIVCFLC